MGLRFLTDPQGVSQPIAKLASPGYIVSVSSTATTATQAFTSQVIRLISTVAVNWGYTSTATTADIRLAANSAEYFEVPLGSTLNAIATATGTLWVHEAI